jgi:hypothetical protein
VKVIRLVPTLQRGNENKDMKCVIKNKKNKKNKILGKQEFSGVKERFYPPARTT